MLMDGNCSSLIIITSPSDTGFRGRCNDPFANTACLITEEEKKKCGEGFFCCYFSELYSEYHYFCHGDIWRRFIKPHEDNLELVLFCYLSDKKELVASGFFSGIASGPAYRDINVGCFVKDVDGDYRYISGGRDESVRFPYDILLPKLNSLSPAGFVRTVSDEEMVSVLKKACSVIDRIGNPSDTTVAGSINAAIDAISCSLASTSPVSTGRELPAELAEWLRELLENAEDVPVEDLKAQVSELQDKAAESENPGYFLVASKLQFLHGDYKYVLSLANFCYFHGHKLKKEKDYAGAKQSFFEAVKLYLLDPVEKNWKKDYINKCVGEFLKLTALEVVEEHGEDQDFKDFFGVMSEKAGSLENYIPIEDLGRRIELQYYASRLERFWDRGDTEGYISFFGESVKGRPCESDIKPVLVARYYQLLAKAQEQQGTPDALLEGAEYRRVAAEKQRNRNDGSYSVSACEDLIEMNKDFALVAFQRGDTNGFLGYIDKAIDMAQDVYKNEPTRRRRENIYFLEGLKYRNLAKKPDDASVTEIVATEKMPTDGAGADVFTRDGIDEGAVAAILSGDTASTFAEALEISKVRFNEAEKLADAGVIDDVELRIRSLVLQSLSFCLVDDIGEEELWDLIDSMSYCRKKAGGMLAVRIAEIVAAWYFCRRFRLTDIDPGQIGVRKAVKLLVQEAVERDIALENEDG
jgi:tetratricopeptide (TPR) repeat protein